MRKSLWVITVFSILLALSFTTSLGKKMPDNTHTWLSRKDSLVAVVYDDYPPFSYKDQNGKLKGYLIDLTREIERNLDIKIKIRVSNHQEIISGLRSGTYDFCPGINQSNDFDDDIVRIHSIIKNEYMIYTLSKNQDASGFMSSDSLTLGIRDGDLIGEFLKLYRNSEIIGYESHLEGLSSLCGGEIDGFAGSQYVCNYISVEEELVDNISRASGLVLYWDLVVATTKDNTNLSDALNWAILELEDSGDLSQLNVKWFDLERKEQEGLGFLIFISFLFLTIMLIILLALAKSRSRIKLSLNREEQALITAKNKVRQADNLLFAISEAANDAQIGIFMIRDTEDIEGKIVMASKGLSNISGYSENELLDMPFMELFEGENKAKIIERYRKRLAGRPEPEAYEIEACRSDGQHIPVELFIKLIETREGLACIGLVRDISRFKILQKRLRNSDQNFRETISGLPNGIIVLNKDRIIYVNNAFRKLVGKSPENIKIQALDNLFPVEYIETIRNTIDKVVTGANYPKEIELEFYDSTQKPVRTNVRFRPINYFGETTVLMIFENFDSGKINSEYHSYNHNMDNLIQFVQSAVLEYNNILMSILGAVSHLNGIIDNSDSSQEYVNIIEKETERASELTEKLLNFTKEEKERTGEIVSLHRVIDDVLELLTIHPTSEIKIEKMLKAKPDTTKGNLSQIHQSVVNLISNALEAVQTDGNITIETGNLTCNEHFCLEHPGADIGRFIYLSVFYSGTELPEDFLSNAFKPFFTTKEFGTGAGLGLSLVYKIAKKHGGFVTAESYPGEGNKFNLYLPEEIVSERPAKPLSPLPQGTETLLVVDDEPMVRTVLEAILKDLGYKIILAEDGDSAIKIINKNEKIDLVILDLVMPGKSGYQVFKEIRNIRPEMKFIISSGYTAEDQVSELLRIGAKALLQKPYRASTIAKVVRKALEEE